MQNTKYFTNTCFELFIYLILELQNMKKMLFWDPFRWNMVTCIGRPKLLLCFRPLQIIITMFLRFEIPWIFYATQETPSTFWFKRGLIIIRWRWWWWRSIYSWKVLCIKNKGISFGLFLGTTLAFLFV